jgi:hypothetical protein
VRDELEYLLLEAGLLQFGSFCDATPFRVNLEMLPAYPDVLHTIVIQSKLLLDSAHISRLLCASDAIPFGVGLSLEMNIPLVYSRGSTDNPVYDLVGAYDIGHPTVLLANIRDRRQELSELIAKAGKAGLEIHSTLAILDLGITTPSHTFEQISLLRLPDLIRSLVKTKQIPTGQAQAVRSWIEKLALHRF